MENSYALLAAVISILAFAIVSKTLFGNKPKRKLPPGPKPWPIIGNMNLIGPNLHLSFHLLSKKYGDIMQLKFFKTTLIVVSSPEMAKQFLKTHDSVFASRPPFAAGKYTSYNYSDVIWAPAGVYWREARKMMNSELLSTNKIEYFKSIRVEERRNFLSRLQAVSGEPIIKRDHVARHILDMLCRMILGDEYYMESTKNSTLNLDDLQELLVEWFRLNAAFYIGNWNPWLGFLDRQGLVKQMKAFRRKFDSLSDSWIDYHLASKKKHGVDFVPKDVIDGLLKIADDPNQEVKLTRDGIKALILDLLRGGTDTTNVAIEWAIHELMKNPPVIEKAKEELDRVVGRKRWVSENNISQLPYLEAIVMETMRLHPPATLLAPHYATENYVVSGYDIYKGTIIMINTWSFGRDANSWDSSGEFLPERYVGKEADMVGNNSALLPFGTGRRMCPGYIFGLGNIRSTLATLLHGFNWKLPESMNPSDVCLEEAYSLTTRPTVTLAIILAERPAIIGETGLKIAQPV